MLHPVQLSAGVQNPNIAPLVVSHLLKYLAYGGGEAPLLPLESLSAAAARGGALGDVGNSIMLPEFGTPFDLLGTELEKT